jgi:restriction system protein
MKTRPTPADYAISDTDISEVEAQDAKADRLKGWVNAGGGIVGGSSFIWAGFVVGFVESSVLAGHHELQGLVGILTYIALVFGTFMIAAALTMTIERWLVHRHPKSDPVRRYKQAITAFEDWWVRTKADHWQRLSGRRFELELARLFNAIGWEAKPTRATGDGGIDIEAKIDGARVIVQCKAHSKPVSPSVARELYGTLLSSKAQSAILASVSGFGRGVHEFIAGKSIELIDLAWILDKQQGLDFERMPTVAGRAGMARWIRRVKPDASLGYGASRRRRHRP